MIPFEHSATIRTEATVSGTLDDFGQGTTVQGSLIFSGAVDVQDISYGARQRFDGDVSLKADADVFFPDGCFPVTVDLRQVVVATYEGVTKTGVVVHVDRLEGSLKVRWE